MRYSQFTIRILSVEIWSNFQEISFKISNVYLNKTSIENYKTYNTLYHQGVEVSNTI